MSVERTLSGIFCDDIRHEMGGKVSLIGCYTDAMLVFEFPTVLPKLCAQVRLMTPSNRPFREVTYQVLKDEEVILEGTPELEAVEGHSSPDGEPTVQYQHAQFVLSPLEITAPCTLKVRAMADGEMLRGLGLKVVKVERR